MPYWHSNRLASSEVGWESSKTKRRWRQSISKRGDIVFQGREKCKARAWKSKMSASSWHAARKSPSHEKRRHRRIKGFGQQRSPDIKGINCIVCILDNSRNNFRVACRPGLLSNQQHSFCIIIESNPWYDICCIGEAESNLISWVENAKLARYIAWLSCGKRAGDAMSLIMV